MGEAMAAYMPHTKAMLVTWLSRPHCQYSRLETVAAQLDASGATPDNKERTPRTFHFTCNMWQCFKDETIPVIALGFTLGVTLT